MRRRTATATATTGVDAGAADDDGAGSSLIGASLSFSCHCECQFHKQDIQQSDNPMFGGRDLDWDDGAIADATAAATAGRVPLPDAAENGLFLQWEMICPSH